MQPVNSRTFGRKDAKFYHTEYATILIKIEVWLMHGNSLKIKSVVDQHNQFAVFTSAGFKLDFKRNITAGMLTPKNSIDKDTATH